MDGVLHFSKEGKITSATIDSDLPILNLFVEFEQRFPDAQTLSYKAYVFKNYLQKLQVSYELLSYGLPVNFIIDSNQFVTYDDVERFIK